MTDNEIVKALDCCMGCNCKECPYCDDEAEECMGKLIIEALKLVNRQKAETERLQKSLVDQFDGYENIRKKAKSEAIKEFAERLKADGFSFVAVKNGRELSETKSYQISAVRLDCLVKEMTEETK